MLPVDEYVFCMWQVQVIMFPDDKLYWGDFGDKQLESRMRIATTALLLNALLQLLVRNSQRERKKKNNYFFLKKNQNLCRSSYPVIPVIFCGPGLWQGDLWIHM